METSAFVGQIERCQALREATIAELGTAGWSVPTQLASGACGTCSLTPTGGSDGS